MSRFIIEGTYDGAVMHRSEHPASSKALRDWAEKTAAITFDDGTKLHLTVSDMAADAVLVPVIFNYSHLIADCARYDVDSVDALIAAEKLA